MKELSHKTVRGLNTDDHNRTDASTKYVVLPTDGTSSYYHVSVLAREDKCLVSGPFEKERPLSTDSVPKTDEPTMWYIMTTDKHDFDKCAGSTADERGLRSVAELGMNLGPSH